jgi:hypothetical protein
MRIKRKMLKDVTGIISVTKRNIQTGEIEKYDCHNTICDAFKFRFTNGKASAFLTYDSRDSKFRCSLAVGDGSTTPTATDTALTHQLFTVKAQTDGVTTISADCKTATAKIKFILPANASYVGNLKECGLVVGDSLVTHSLFKDAEGNPITIEKTDLDEVVITYIISITSNSANGAIGFAEATGIKALAGIPSASTDYAQIHAHVNKMHLSHDANYVYVKKTYHEQIAQGNPGTQDAPYIVVPVTRIAQQHAFNNHFIQSIALTGCSSDEWMPQDVFTLPDFDVMAQAELKDYLIGTGDGSTTDFTPPIPAWLANTEKIYVNDVLKTRGVDYTCDPKHNLQHNIELMPIFNANIISGHIGKSGIGNQYVSSIYIADDGTSIRRVEDTNELVGFAVAKNANRDFNLIYLTPSDPFILELADEDALLSNTVDTIYISTYWQDSSKSQYNYDEVTLEASDDLENWETILSNVTGRPDGVREASPDSKPLSQWAKYTLATPVNKKYWRISIDMAGTSKHDNFGLLLMHEGAPIHFSTAPSAGDVIKMDCGIDRIWKDDQHVADVTLTWEP